MSENVEQRLRALNALKGDLAEQARIFERAQTPKDVARAIKGKGYGCSAEQFLFFNFHALQRLRPELLQEAEQGLVDIGISPEHIREYMQRQSPRSLLDCKYRKIYPPDVREKFNREARQFALDKIKEYLGINEQSA